MSVEKNFKNSKMMNFVGNNEKSQYEKNIDDIKTEKLNLYKLKEEFVK